MVESHFSFISCTDIVQVFQSVFPDDMIAGPLENWSMFFGIHPYLMESIERKYKKEDIDVLLFDESLIQQLKKNQLDIQAILELSYKFK